MRSTLVLFFALAASLAAVTAANAIPVKALRIVGKTADYQITVKYPHTGVATIDAEIAIWAKKQTVDFIAYVKSDREEGSPWEMSVDYKIARNDAQMFEVLFKREIGDDGNHTHFEFTSFDYLMPDAHRVFIPEVVIPAAYAKMRAYAAAHMVPEDPDFDAEATEGSLAPVPDTFAAFTISPSAITVWFTPEQLENMTSAGGRATIPLTELKGMIRANRRAPVPSFDCAKAAATVEKAICSNVALARLDRDMAQWYRRWLAWNEHNAKWLAWQHEDQQSWLAERAKACPAGAASIACLTRFYQARIKVLQKPPHA